MVVHLLLLRGDGPVLLDLPELRLCHLPAVHVSEFLGPVLQRDHLDLPGLLIPERAGESVDMAHYQHRWDYCLSPFYGGFHSRG